MKKSSKYILQLVNFLCLLSVAALLPDNISLIRAFLIIMLVIIIEMISRVLGGDLAFKYIKFVNGLRLKLLRLKDDKSKSPDVKLALGRILADIRRLKE